MLQQKAETLDAAATLARGGQGPMVRSPEEHSDTRRQTSRLGAWLKPGERLLWEDQPKQGFVFRAGDIGAIPFSLLWAGFAVYWLGGVIGIGAPWLFVNVGITGALMGGYMTVGRFLVERRLRTNTVYALTDRRVLILGGVREPVLRSFELSQLGSVRFEYGLNGYGSIRLGVRDPVAGMASQLSWPRPLLRPEATIVDVKAAKSVLAMLEEAREQTSS